MHVIDPITNLISGSNDKEVYSMLMRLIDYLKNAGITTVFVSLTSGGAELEQSSAGVSSLTDTWILLRDVELNGERNRCIYLLKSRGMAHSNQLREFVITSNGIRLIRPYIGPGGVLTGSSRMNQEARESAEAAQRQAEDLRRQQEMERRRLSLQVQVESLQAELAAVDREVATIARENEDREKRFELDRANLLRSRRAD